MGMGYHTWQQAKGKGLGLEMFSEPDLLLPPLPTPQLLHLTGTASGSRRGGGGGMGGEDGSGNSPVAASPMDRDQRLSPCLSLALGE